MMPKKEKNPKIKTWQIIGKVLGYIIVAIILLGAVFLIFSKFSVKGVKIFTVQSGSMAPAIKIGSVVFSKSTSNYKIGDVITFKSLTSDKDPITHRIVEIKTVNNNQQFETKGDANNAVDSSLITQSQIIGKVNFHVAYIGYLLIFMRTVPGLILLIIIPATIIIYDEVLKIKKEIKEYVVDRDKLSHQKSVKNKSVKTQLGFLEKFSKLIHKFKIYLIEMDKKSKKNYQFKNEKIN